MSPRAVLIGPPGSGKTTVGVALAAALGVDFRDTDADIVLLAGKPVSDIFVDDGEARFRELEREAVRTALAEHEGVLALGGGAILAPETQELLAGHRVVYLEVSLEEAVKRVGLTAARPLLVFNPRSQLRKLMSERLPIYQRLAEITAVTTGRAEDEVVAELAAALETAR
ncbi:shikimate kinase [Actinocorallia sp. A-T 12471]|uniref:shikimate kinase n=1 Tax=Actinocorallia sp. A-T 12471 TaxID=3089813 RepID=UPI0029CFBB57|nr:shikimate kinase [Actinocorallia sp. A-T 12471]MDX6743096.1 shikimate kinase [Actinocorallia sp. A-T 12471]